MKICGIVYTYLRRTQITHAMQKGFTLIELLIVIAILAVLSVAVVVVLNPAELLRQARDTTRLADIDAVNRSLTLFLTDVSTTTWPATGTRCTSGTTNPQSGACTASAATAVNGTGWVPVTFTAISIGSPLPRLPLDPVNDDTATACAGTVDGCYYAFESNGTYGKYKLFVNLESTKYSPQETNAKDGGNVNDWFELGSDLSL
jgi:prepilin-type N-terminal cleavage/methylation domain-containing protein